MAKKYQVDQYSTEKLQELLTTEKFNNLSIIKGKQHLHYFRSYFGPEGVDAKTIVTEIEYVDHDYLLDYAGYYVRCFDEYARKCKRLHFFSIPFNEEDFQKILFGNTNLRISEADLQENYIGFVVSRPLPETVIGRTCLKTYDSEQTRHYPIIRVYKATLFGIPLVVKTLAFQEQDKAVGACATSALWSMFQGTGFLFHHYIPSPIEVTQSASTILSELEPRSFPSKGLDVAQIAQAIRSVGLEPFRVDAWSEFVFKSTVYGYLRGRIPLLLACAIVDRSIPTQSNIEWHAVAVTGYSTSLKGPKLGTVENDKYYHGSFRLTATRIDKVYAHDDQIGPFARMTWLDEKLKIDVDGTESEFNALDTSYKDVKGEIGNVKAVPWILFVPLYHKIRIPLEVVLDTIIEFNDIYDLVSSIFGDELPSPREWDVYLTSVNDFKKDIFDLENIEEKLKEEILTLSFPKYLWRASLVSEENLVLDFLFDATDIEQSSIFCYAIIHDPTHKAFLAGVATSAITSGYKFTTQVKGILDSLSSN
ncbi:MAG: hypothetical protein IIA17_07430 [candidate division Zixibacteria bacterium]|nr:hypothetical protein [candidate division Zixibacteria bacterium]